MSRFQHEAVAKRVTGIKLLLPDEQPVRRARLTAAEVLDLFGRSAEAPVESRPFPAPWLLSPSQD